MIYVGQQEIKKEPATFLLPNRHGITQHLNEDLFLGYKNSFLIFFSLSCLLLPLS